MNAMMGIRLSAEQIRDLEEIARVHCNTRSGLIRLAIDQFRASFRAAQERQKTEPEQRPADGSQFFQTTTGGAAMKRRKKPMTVMRAFAAGWVLGLTWGKACSAIAKQQPPKEVR